MVIYAKPIVYSLTEKYFVTQLPTSYVLFGHVLTPVFDKIVLGIRY